MSDYIKQLETEVRQYRRGVTATQPTWVGVFFAQSRHLITCAREGAESDTLDMLGCRATETLQDAHTGKKAHATPLALVSAMERMVTRTERARRTSS